MVVRLRVNPTNRFLRNRWDSRRCKQDLAYQTIQIPTENNTLFEVLF